MTFKETCEQFGITPVTLTFSVTQDVHNELEIIAHLNEVTLEELLRDIIDDFLLNQPEG